MHFNRFFIIPIILCANIQLICMGQSKDNDLSDSKKILQMVPVIVHHEHDSLQALLLAFKKIREIKDVSVLLEAGKYNKSLAELKSLWDSFTELEHQDSVLAAIYPNHSQEILKFRQEYATNFLLTSIQLMDEEKIKQFRMHKIILYSLVPLITAVGICANLYTYFGMCNKI